MISVDVKVLKFLLRKHFTHDFDQSSLNPLCTEFIHGFFWAAQEQSSAQKPLLSIISQPAGR